MLCLASGCSDALHRACTQPAQAFFCNVCSWGCSPPASVADECQATVHNVQITKNPSRHTPRDCLFYVHAGTPNTYISYAGIQMCMSIKHRAMKTLLTLQVRHITSSITGLMMNVSSLAFAKPCHARSVFRRMCPLLQNQDFTNLDRRQMHKRALRD